MLGAKGGTSCPLMLQFDVSAGLLKGRTAIAVVRGSCTTGSDALPGGEEI